MFRNVLPACLTIVGITFSNSLYLKHSKLGFRLLFLMLAQTQLIDMGREVCNKSSNFLRRNLWTNDLGYVLTILRNGPHIAMEKILNERL